MRVTELPLGAIRSQYCVSQPHGTEGLLTVSWKPVSLQMIQFIYELAEHSDCTAIYIGL